MEEKIFTKTGKLKDYYRIGKMLGSGKNMS
jgi:hypothetical protein